MKKILPFLLVFCIFVTVLKAQSAECPIVPQPREFQSDGSLMQIPSGQGTVILANPACAYAPERFQALIRNRFKLLFPIVAEEDLSTDVTRVFCFRVNPELDLPMNGFTIDFTVKNPSGREVVTVTGKDLSGVCFGAEALFGLTRFFKASDVKPEPILAIQRARVRDWPSIPWRGRPHSVTLQHLVPGQMDAYVHARLNFSDFRDDPDVPASLTMDARKASMGCVPGKPIDRELFLRTFREFKRRGFFIYGTVSCQLGKQPKEKIGETFDALLALGCDGIWLSMDDSGGGADPVGVARYVAEYMKAREISGHRMAFTPGGAEYTTIEKPLNHEMAKIDGFNGGFWIFTRVPCAADLKLCQEIGLKQKPCWWFNYCETAYPDPKAGFIHSSSILTTQRKDGRPSYMNLLSITPGWGSPQFEKIRDAAQYTDQVNLWALCGGWPSEYALVMFGLWAWNPETCDWPTLRDSIYDFVWGPDQVETAREFDSLFAELKTLYWLPENWKFRAPKNSLVRLKSVENRAKALELLDRLDELAAKLAAEAPKQSALDPERLEYQFVEPMRASLIYARKQATLEYPDYAYAEFEKDLAAGKTTYADVEVNLNRILATLSAELADLKDVEPVLNLWRERLKKAKP